MKIVFNKVTWYSKLAAVLFFVFILPAWAFYIGLRYEQSLPQPQGILFSQPQQMVSARQQALSTQSASSSIDIFKAKGIQKEQHTVIRFDFIFDIPDWMAENWDWGRFYVYNDYWEISPKIDQSINDFDNIYFFSDYSREDYNADTLYNYALTHTDVSFGKVRSSEIFFNNEQNIRIYHLQFEDKTYASDIFYIDNDEKTIRVDVKSVQSNGLEYINAIKSFLQMVRKSGTPQG